MEREIKKEVRDGALEGKCRWTKLPPRGLANHGTDEALGSRFQNVSRPCTTFLLLCRGDARRFTQDIFASRCNGRAEGSPEAARIAVHARKVA